MDNKSYGGGPGTPGGNLTSRTTPPPPALGGCAAFLPFNELFLGFSARGNESPPPPLFPPPPEEPPLRNLSGGVSMRWFSARFASPSAPSHSSLSQAGSISDPPIIFADSMKSSYDDIVATAIGAESS